MGVLETLCIVTILATAAYAGCRDENFCCKGKSNSCKANGPSLNSNATDSFCFCDEHCLVTGDCCTDFKSHCKQQDCVLDKWEPFGKCSKNCGYGHKRRERRIIQESKNGGAPCGKTYQRTYCYGTKCKFSRGSLGSVVTLRELAKLMPIEYSKYRDMPKFNGNHGIRKYVFNIKKKDKRYDQPKTCAIYKIVRANKKCQKIDDWRSMFVAKEEVCVQCDQVAMRARHDFTCKGQGIEGRKTRWTTVGNRSCRGQWILLSQRKACNCNPTSTSSFIFL